MAEAITGRCPMWRLVKPLRYSHLLPASLYPHIAVPGSHAVRVGDGVVYPSDRHIKAHVLCKDCEDILSKGGETWVCPKLAWLNGSFPLYERFISGATVFGENEAEALLYAGGNPKINVQKLVHFALGIFWKAAVHSWRAPQDPMIDL